MLHVIQRLWYKRDFACEHCVQFRKQLFSRKKGKRGNSTGTEWIQHRRIQSEWSVPFREDLKPELREESADWARDRGTGRYTYDWSWRAAQTSRSAAFSPAAFWSDFRYPEWNSTENLAIVAHFALFLLGLKHFHRLINPYCNSLDDSFPTRRVLNVFVFIRFPNPILRIQQDCSRLVFAGARSILELRVRPQRLAHFAAFSDREQIHHHGLWMDWWVWTVLRR